MKKGFEPICDDELLYRRIPHNLDYYNPSAIIPLSRQAFTPIKKDISGISVTRAKYLSPEEVAASGLNKEYYVAVLRSK